MRVASWLQRDAYQAQVARLRSLQLDMGPSFASELHQGAALSTLTITSCFYQRLLEEEGLPQLLPCLCCSQDRVYFEGVPRRGVAAALISSLAEGDTHCCFMVQKLPS